MPARADGGAEATKLVVHPLTEDRWSDLETVFAARGCAVARGLLAGAIRWARQRGVRLLEAYPVDKAHPSASDAPWFGSKEMFDEAGFEEVPARPVVRLRLGWRLPARGGIRPPAPPDAARSTGSIPRPAAAG